MSDDVRIERAGGLGRIRLNRPKAIHALTREMCVAMADALVAWRTDEGVRLVTIDHLPAPDGDPKLSRGFCAGGDIRAMWDSARSDGAAARAFFFDEYRLNHLLFTYAKPIVAFMDGITMGGGVGISQPARFRVTTERTALAMPETGIGLFPDVGGGWYLSRMPGRTGAFLALTGARLDGAECMALGLATHFISSDALDGVKARLSDAPADAEAILAEAQVAPPEARIARNRDAIDRLFAASRFEAILEALEQDGSAWAARELATLAAKSPQSCKVSLRLIEQGRDHADFADEMRVEYGVATHVVQRHDFIEGVRALIVDKTNDPRWQPATADAVSDGLIDQIFAPLPDDAAWQPLSL